MEKCAFCKIAEKDIKANIIKETEDWICFEDLNPKAPVHFLLIPKKHYDNLHNVADEEVLGKLMLGVIDIVKLKNLEKSGYRIVVNTGRDGGQTVFHLHIHILALRAMGWPPG
ncbi:MAG: histidine triad nucleotide-binding protein [Spirochaetia bacterium]|nr:histidine triad nucleotide-binding protein [Spirochaetia bacterium]